MQTKCGHFYLFQPQVVKMTAQTSPRLHWYIFAWWQLHLGCLATMSVSVKSKTWEWTWVPFTEAVFVRQSSAEQCGAHQHQPGADLDDPSVMKVGVFSSSLAYLQVLFCFLKDILTQQMDYFLYWVFIMRDNRIWNLAFKMTTHGLSSRNRILAPLVLYTYKHRQVLRIHSSLYSKEL